MLRYVALLACLLGLVLTVGCRSTEDPTEPVDAVACVCGTPEADFSGCYCDDCLSGEGNPENPLCTCRPLRIRGEEG